jgi:hypothetical protein
LILEPNIQRTGTHKDLQSFMVELKELMQAYLARWKAVEELQLKEQHSATPELQRRQLKLLMGWQKVLVGLKTWFQVLIMPDQSF